MFFFLNLDVYFDIICAGLVYPTGKGYPYLLIFAEHNVEYLGQT